MVNSVGGMKEEDQEEIAERLAGGVEVEIGE